VSHIENTDPLHDIVVVDNRCRRFGHAGAPLLSHNDAVRAWLGLPTMTSLEMEKA
jgi:hypothetical protein